MSHFCVAVITDGTKGVEEMLAPYQENSMGDVPREYLRFYDAAETERESYEGGSGEFVRYKDRLYGIHDKEFDFDHGMVKSLPHVSIPFTTLYPTIEEYLRDWGGYEDVDPETGRYGYWENPNAKWDWWVELTIGWVDEYMGGTPTCRPARARYSRSTSTSWTRTRRS